MVLIGTPSWQQEIQTQAGNCKENAPQIYSRFIDGKQVFVDLISRETMKACLNQLEITEESLIKELTKTCKNMRRLHDVVVHLKTEAERTGEQLSLMFYNKVFTT